MIKSLQVLRGVAAISVVFYHIFFISNIYLNMTWNNNLRFLHLGVDVFFILSGFIMYYVLHNKKIDINSSLSFIKARIIRVVPLYWLITLIMYLAYNYIFHDYKSLAYLVKSMLFIPYNDSDSGIYPILGVGWTLNYEMFFYFLVFISLIIFRDSFFKSVSFIIVFLVCVGFILSPSTENPIIYTYTRIYLIEFLFGFWISFFYVRNKRNKKNLIEYKNIIFIAMFLMFFLSLNNIIPSVIEPVILSFFVFLTFLSYEKSFQKAKYVNVGMYLGSISYMLYLIHQPLLSVLGKLYFQNLNYTDLNVFSFFSLLFIFPVTMVSYHVYNLLFVKITTFSTKL